LDRDSGGVGGPLKCDLLVHSIDEVDASSALVGSPLGYFIITDGGSKVGVVAFGMMETERDRVAEYVLSSYCGSGEAGSESEENRSPHIDLMIFIVCCLTVVDDMS